MKALTVRQPWAWALAVGVKGIENRTWGTRYRGPVAIHAGTGLSRRGDVSPLIMLDYGEMLDRACHGQGINQLDPDTPEAHMIDIMFARGAVLAVGDLVDCHVAEREWMELNDVDGAMAPCCSDRYAEFEVYSDDARDTGREVWHWVFENVQLLDEPVPCRGALQLWTVPPDVDEAVAAQLAVAA